MARNKHLGRRCWLRVVMFDVRLLLLLWYYCCCLVVLVLVLLKHDVNVALSDLLPRRTETKHIYRHREASYLLPITLLLPDIAPPSPTPALRCCPNQLPGIDSGDLSPPAAWYLLRPSQTATTEDALSASHLTSDLLNAKKESRPSEDKRAATNAGLLPHDLGTYAMEPWALQKTAASHVVEPNAELLRG